MSIIAFTDPEYGSFAIACSRENREKVQHFIEKRYPEWAARCKGMVGVCPGNHVMDAVRDMRELLEDEKLQYISGCTMVHFPNRIEEG